MRNKLWTVLVFVLGAVLGSALHWYAVYPILRGVKHERQRVAEMLDERHRNMNSQELLRARMRQAEIKSHFKVKRREKRTTDKDWGRRLVWLAYYAWQDYKEKQEQQKEQVA